MAIIVHSIDKIFHLEVEAEDQKIVFGFKQLNYKTKAKISGLITSVEQGMLIVDAPLQVFYNLKHSLKEVYGLEDAEGNPYKLKFETIKKEALTDEIVDELLAAVISDPIMYMARALADNAVPDELLNPITGEKLEGVEVVKNPRGIAKK